MGTIKDVLTAVVTTLRSQVPDLLTSTQRQNLGDTSGQWIWYKEPYKNAIYPLMSITATRPVLTEAGLDEGGYNSLVLVTQQFNGTGTQKTFSLTYYPEFIDSVEYPIGTFLTVGDDYTTEDQDLVLRSAPALGTNNVRILYRKNYDSDYIYTFFSDMSFTCSIWTARNTELTIGSEKYTGNKLNEYLVDYVVSKWVGIRHTLDDSYSFTEYISNITSTPSEYDPETGIIRTSLSFDVRSLVHYAQADISSVYPITTIEWNLPDYNETFTQTS